MIIEDQLHEKVKGHERVYSKSGQADKKETIITYNMWYIFIYIYEQWLVICLYLRPPIIVFNIVFDLFTAYEPVELWI